MPINLLTLDSLTQAPAGNLGRGLPATGGFRPLTLEDFGPIDIGDKQPDRTLLGTAGDAANMAAKSVIATGEVAVGLANIPTWGKAGKMLEEHIGYDPERARKILDDTLASPAQLWADKQVQQADGFVDSAKAAILNPSTIVTAVGESIGPMATGVGIGGLGLKAAPKLFKFLSPKAPWLAAGAAGEGVVTAGSNVEGIRQQTEYGELTTKQLAYGVGSGFLTGVLGAAGGKLARHFKVTDVDNFLLQTAKAAPEVKKGIFQRVLGGAISEGLIEEMPQSWQEQIASNLALDKPWDEGVGKAAAMGALTGAAMGGGMQLWQGRKSDEPAAPPRSAPLVAQAFTEVGGAGEAVTELQSARSAIAHVLSTFDEEDASRVISTVSAGNPQLAEQLSAARQDPELVKAGGQILLGDKHIAYTALRDMLREDAGLIETDPSESSSAQIAEELTQLFPNVFAQQAPVSPPAGAEQQPTPAAPLNSAGFVPESIEQIQAQINAVREGRKPAVVIGKEEAQLADINGLSQGVARGPDGAEAFILAPTDEAVNAAITRAAEVGIKQAMGEILGYAQPGLTEGTNEPTAVVQQVDEQTGAVIQDEIITPDATGSVNRIPGTTVRVLPVQQALMERAGQVAQPVSQPAETPTTAVIPPATAVAPRVAELVSSLNSGNALEEGAPDAIDPGSIQEVDLKKVPDKNLSRRLKQLAEAVKQAYGTDVVYIDTPSGAVMRNDKTEFTAFNGLAMPGSNRVYLNVKAATPLNTMGHELSHVLEVQFPEVYARLEETVLGRMRYKAAKDLKRKLTSAIDAESRGGKSADDRITEIRSEMVAESLGEMLQDPALWSEIFSGIRDKAEAKSLYDRVIEAVGKLAKSFTKVGYIDGIKDMQAVRKAVTEAYLEWSRLNEGGAKPAKAEKALLSRPTVAQKISDGQEVTEDEIASDPKVAKLYAALEARRAEASEMKPGFDAVVDAIAKATGTKAIKVSVKGMKRAFEKAWLDYGGKDGAPDAADRVKDLLRATVAFKDTADIPSIIATVKEKFPGATVKRNGYEKGAKASEEGYRDVFFSVTYMGRAVELQANHPLMLAAKDKFHIDYEFTRTVEATRPENDLQRTHEGGWLPPVLRLRYLTSLARQRVAYSGAWLRVLDEATSNPLDATSDKNSSLEIGREPSLSGNAALTQRPPGTSQIRQLKSSQATAYPSESQNLSKTAATSAARKGLDSSISSSSDTTRTDHSTSDPVYGLVKFSRKDIAKAIKGDLSGNPMEFLPEPTDAMLRYGVLGRPLPVAITPVVLNKIGTGKNTGRGSSRTPMTPEQIESLPAYVKSPAAVFDDPSDKDSLVFMTSMVMDDTDPVVVAIGKRPVNNQLPVKMIGGALRKTAFSNVNTAFQKGWDRFGSWMAGDGVLKMVDPAQVEAAVINGMPKRLARSLREAALNSKGRVYVVGGSAALDRIAYPIGAMTASGVQQQPSELPSTTAKPTVALPAGSVNPATGKKILGVKKTLAQRVNPLSSTVSQQDAVDRVRRRVNRKAGVGAPTNERRVLDNGKRTFVIGQPTTDDWIGKAERHLPGDQLSEARSWYQQLHDFLSPLYGHNAEKYALAWLLSQKRASPSKGMMDVLRAVDIVNGKPRVTRVVDGEVKELTAGLNEGALLQALTGVYTGHGIGPKLLDFVDSELGKTTRTAVRDYRQGRQPAAIDVWAYRDVGFVDETVLEFIRKNFGEEAATNITADASYGETQYEYGIDFYNNLAEELNRRGYMGGGWNASQIQAVGWVSTQAAMGIEAEFVRDIVGVNTKRVSIGLSPGEGSRLGGAIPATRALEIIEDLAQLSGVKVLKTEVGVGAYMQYMEGSIQIDAFASPEAIKDFMDMLGYAMQQTEIIATRPMKSGTRMAVDISAPQLTDITKAREFFDAFLVKQAEYGGVVAPGFQQTSDGLRLLNFGGKWEGQRLLSLYDAMIDAANETGVEITGATERNVTLESTKNDWTKQTDGETYLGSLRDRGRLQEAQQLAGRYGASRLDIKFSRTGLAEPARGPDQGRREGAGSVSGAVHYSHTGFLDRLFGQAFGAGIRGAEQGRLNEPGVDPRIKRRVYFYLPAVGGLPTPEAGLGTHVYKANLSNLYDPQAMPAIAGSGNALETAILDAGYRGYLNREQGTAVVLNEDVPVKYQGTRDGKITVPRVSERVIPMLSTRTEGDEVVRRMDQPVGLKAKEAAKAAAPSFRLEYGEARVRSGEKDAANAALAASGSQFRLSRSIAAANEALAASGIQELDQAKLEDYNERRFEDGGMRPAAVIQAPWEEYAGYMRLQFYAADPLGEDVGVLRTAYYYPDGVSGGDGRAVLIVEDEDGREIYDSSKSAPGIRLSRSSMADDSKAQQEWLNAQARERGFADIDALAGEDIDAFIKLAEQWREDHPAEVLASRIAAPIADPDGVIRVNGREYAARTEPYTKEGTKQYMKRAVDVLPRPASLPYEPERFFAYTPRTVVLPVSSIASSKSAEENAQGGSNAPKRFLAAYDGILSPREPIAVMPSDGAFKVIDGNGTLTAFKSYGWENIPVEVYESEEAFNAAQGKAGPQYRAYILKDVDRRKLLDQFPPTHPIVVADHITADPADVGPARGTVVGEFDRDGVQALIVEVNGTSTRPDGQLYHISISAAERGNMRHAGRLAAEGFTPVDPVEIDLSNGPDYSSPMRPPSNPDIRFSRAFKEWFGDSKVVDAQGKPLVVYHGTNAEFTTFFDSAPIYFAKQEVYARSQSRGGRTVPVYVSIQNPASAEQYNRAINGTDTWAQARARLEGLGLDGVVDSDGGSAVIAFRPEQIKSATGNTGAYDPENPDIRFSRPLKAMSAQEAIDSIGAKPAYDLQDAIERDQWSDAYTLAKNPVQRQKLLGKIGDWLIKTFPDSMIPVKRWIDGAQISASLKQRMTGNLYRASTLRSAMQKEVKQKFIDPMFRSLEAAADKTGLTSDQIKRDVGYWMTAKYAPKANAFLIAKDRTALILAQQSQDPAAIAKAQQNLADRIADVNAPRNTPRKRGVAGGFNDAEAAALVRKVEAAIPRAMLDDVAKHVYAMLAWKKAKDLASGKVSQSMVNSWPNHRDYVPLTGDPRFTPETEDVFSSGGQVNQEVDKAMNGRKESISDDAFDAAFTAVVKSINFSGMQDFKRTLAEAYDEAKAAGVDIGLTREPVTGIIRVGDDVVIHRDTVTAPNGLQTSRASAYRFADRAIIEALKREHEEKVNAYLNLIATPTRWYGKAVTQWMPLFAPINFIRDLWERSELLRTRTLLDTNGRAIDVDKVARRAIAESVSPQLWKAAGKENFRRPMTQWTGTGTDPRADLREMIELGGSSVWGDFLARNSGDLEGELRRSFGKTAATARAMNQMVEDYNNVFEMVAPLSIYRGLKAAGMAPKEAAAATLDLMNFKKRGTVMPGIRALYVFAQPAATSGYNLAQYLSTRKGRIRFTAQLLIGVALYAFLKSLWGDDEEDEELGNRLDNLSNYTVERTIPIPVGDMVLKVPVGFGPPQLAWAAAGVINRWASGRYDTPAALGELAKGWAKSVSPVAPSDVEIAKNPVFWLLSTLTPTVLKPLFSIGADKTPFGQPLTPQFKDPEKFRSEQSKRTTPDTYRELATDIREMTGVDLYPDHLKTLVDGYLVGPARELIHNFVENPAKEQRGEPKRPMILAQVLDNVNDRQILNSVYYRVRGEAEEANREYMSRLADGTLGDWLDGDKMQLVQAYKRMEHAERSLGAMRGTLTKARATMDPDELAARTQEIEERVDQVRRDVMRSVLGK